MTYQIVVRTEDSIDIFKKGLSGNEALYQAKQKAETYLEEDYYMTLENKFAYVFDYNDEQVVEIEIQNESNQLPRRA